MLSEREQIGGPSWLHNMSVPPSSRLRCARATVPAHRYLVDWLPRGVTAASAAYWTDKMHARIARHGMRALAALVDLYRARLRPTPALMWAKVRIGGGDAAARVEGAFEAALERGALPGGMGVFLPAPPQPEGGGRSGGRLLRLDRVASLAVLARRSGPLYVPGRPIEPSLIVLERCVLVFPGTAPSGPDAARDQLRCAAPAGGVR